ncbi:MAG: TldD/PmbA family protein, partial [bacterium]|nr:TldD/PmbA family protein [bacterium]
KNKKSVNVAISGHNFDDMESKIKTAIDSMAYLGEDEARRLLKQPEFEGKEFEGKEFEGKEFEGKEFEGKEFEGKEFEGKFQELDLDDNHYDALNNDEITAVLKDIEKSALAYNDKIIPSEVAEFSGSQIKIYLFSTEGLAKSFSKSYYSYAYNAVADSDGHKEVDYWYENKRSYKELSKPGVVETIGVKAAERAIKRLGGKKIKSAEMPVVFTTRTASSLLGLLCEAMDGEEIFYKRSFLVNKLGQQLFQKNISVIDAPIIKGSMGGYPFDGEGMNGRNKTLIEKGKLLGYLHNSYSATKLNMDLTGNASRGYSSPPGISVGNFYLEAGQGNLDDLVHGMKNGLLVEDLFTSGMNPVTGDLSFGCSGILVENGVATAPVKEITLAGNVLDIFNNICEIADDNDFRKSITSPSFMVSKLAVSGY